MALFEAIIHLLDRPEDVLQFLSSLERLAKDASRLYKLIQAQVSSFLDKTSSLEIGEKEIRDKERKCRRLFNCAEIKAQSFRDIVERLFDYADLAEDRIVSMKESFKNGDTGCIANFIAQIKKYLNRCQKAYSNFQEKYNEAIELCEYISEECRVKSVEAKALKITSGVTGAVVASGTSVATLASGAAAAGVT